jgi:hypothetical protein
MKSKLFVFNYLITITFFIFSCGPSEKRDLGRVTPKTSKISSLTNSKTNFNIYIENSGSMNGYVNVNDSTTKFKKCLQTIYGTISRSSIYKSASINFINKSICKQNVKIGDEITFLQKLNKQTFENSGCDFRESSLPEIINLAISSNPDDINLLFSDCIISKNTKKDGPSINWLTAAEQILRTSLKRELDKNEFSCIIFKMNSEFYGTYCIENKSQNQKTKNPILHGSNRPYYIIISGKPNAIDSFMSNINLKEYKDIGFENSYYLLPPNPNTFIRTKILKKSNYDLPKQINTKSKKTSSHLTIINANKDNNDIRNSSFNFTLVANLDTLKIDNSFLNDKNNYEITNNWHIKNIEPNLDENNLALRGYSHIFTIQTDSLLSFQNVSLSLKYKLPNWVDESNNIDDSRALDSIQKHQTFGIKNLLNAFSQSYGNDKYNGKSMFETTIKIAKSSKDEVVPSSSFPWWIFIVILCCTGIFIYFKNKK